MRRRLLTAVLAVALSLGGCADASGAARPGNRAAAARTGRRLRHAAMACDCHTATWLPEASQPWAVVLALHGMNDSRDAWEYPGAGVRRRAALPCSPPTSVASATPRCAVIGPARRRWWTMRATMALLLRQRYPRAKLILMGESMGAAVLMCLATDPDPPPVDGYVLVAPAVWGRAEMNVFLRAQPVARLPT